MVEDHIQCVVQDVRDTVKGALKDGLEAVEKALQDGRKAVKRAHNDVPVYHDSRLGGLIDDSWTVVRLLEASLVDDLGPLKQSIPGCVGKLGSLNLPANAKELKLVQSAAQRFLSLMQQTCEESLSEIIDAVLDEEEGIIMDTFYLKDEKDVNIDAIARTISRRKFGEQSSKSSKLQQQLRERCLEQVMDAGTKMGRESRDLLHSVVDLAVDISLRAHAKTQSDVGLQAVDERKALQFESSVSGQGAAPETPAPEAQKVDAPRTT